MGEGAARRPIVWEAPGPIPGPREGRVGRTPEKRGGKEPAAGPGRRSPLLAEKMSAKTAAGEPPGRTRRRGEKPSRALPPRERARARVQSAARAVAMGEGGNKSPRATGTARRGEGRQTSKDVRARARGGERACARRPEPFSARFGLAPGPPPLPHPARALPHPLTRRRRLRPPPPRGRGAAAAAARVPESLGAWSRRLASPVRPPQPTPPTPSFLRGRSGLRLRHSHLAWAALHVSTTNYARQHAAARVAGPAGNRSTPRGLVRRRRNHTGKCSFVRPEGSSTLSSKNYDSRLPVARKVWGADRSKQRIPETFH